VDFRGAEVTGENFFRVLTGRQAADVPISKRLSSDEDSNVFVFLTGACARIPPPNPPPTLPYPVQGPDYTDTSSHAYGDVCVRAGHGGEHFLKFQDAETISSIELADVLAQMWEKRRYRELLFVVDTCHGEGMFTEFYSPNILALSSSNLHEDSMSASTLLSHPSLACLVVLDTDWTLACRKNNQLRTFFRLTFRPFHCSLPLLHSTSPHRTCPGLSMRLSQPSQAANSMILGQSLIDQFTDVTLRFMEENLHPGGNCSVTVADLVCSSAYPPPPPARCPD